MHAVLGYKRSFNAIELGWFNLGHLELQIYNTFYSKAWERNRAIDIEDCLLTCHGYKYHPDEDAGNKCGARYCTAFSPQFPHFEVSNKLKCGVEVNRL